MRGRSRIARGIGIAGTIRIFLQKEKNCIRISQNCCCDPGRPITWRRRHQNVPLTLFSRAVPLTDSIFSGLPDHDAGKAMQKRSFGSEPTRQNAASIMGMRSTRKKQPWRR
jgi:hypothetical protein